MITTKADTPHSKQIASIIKWIIKDTFTWSGRPAQWCFGGIRKLITCEDPDNKPSDGTEITYLEMEVSDKDSFSKLLNGEPVEVRYS